MTLGDVVKQYREKNNMSMDEFSKRCSLSKGYISMIENNINPRNNKPIAPTLPSINKIAKGMNLDLDTLLKLIDGDQLVTLDQSTTTNKDTSLTKKDEKDIEKILESTKEQLLYQEGLMFDGEPASPEAIDSILAAMQIGMEMAKKKNKEKYTPKKYKKD